MFVGISGEHKSIVEGVTERRSIVTIPDGDAVAVGVLGIAPVDIMVGVIGIVPVDIIVGVIGIVPVDFTCGL